ncbi:MAG: M20/M25/M40 family metallo-hydrolase [Acidobacteriota bacterium]|nr:M20/M25/M40 family metallo-hydrolase [Acidobacteriota bacterium]
MTALRSALEEKVVARIRDRRDELVGLVGELVACDTTSRNYNEPARDEEKLQKILARRLEALGATPDLWVPEPVREGHRNLPPGMRFDGRPQLAAHLAGGGAGGRSLLLNGHIDAVDVEPRADWTSDPLVATARGGRLYGRGVNDMKGGIACLVTALETLREEGVRLDGDVVFCTVTDEEMGGAGGFAAVEHGVRADAGICAEPSALNVEAACRGGLPITVTALGRTGHAELAHPDWREGGPVNAIEKLLPVLLEVQRMREDWRTRPDHQHPLLPPGDIVPTIIAGGTWVVTIPHECTVTLDVTYLPGHLDAEGTGRAVEREITDRLHAAVADDPWFDEHPLRIEFIQDVVPAEVPADHGIVQLALGAAGDLGHDPRVTGLDTWHDAATFTRFGTPTVSFGPDCENSHAVDESVSIDSLVDCAAAVALIAMRWCGVRGQT